MPLKIFDSILSPPPPPPSPLPPPARPSDVPKVTQITHKVPDINAKRDLLMLLALSDVQESMDWAKKEVLMLQKEREGRERMEQVPQKSPADPERTLFKSHTNEP